MIKKIAQIFSKKKQLQSQENYLQNSVDLLVKYPKMFEIQEIDSNNVHFKTLRFSFIHAGFNSAHFNSLKEIGSTHIQYNFSASKTAYIRLKILNDLSSSLNKMLVQYKSDFPVFKHMYDKYEETFNVILLSLKGVEDLENEQLQKVLDITQIVEEDFNKVQADLDKTKSSQQQVNQKVIANALEEELRMVKGFRELNRSIYLEEKN